MERIQLSEVKNLVEYEKARDGMRARVIEADLATQADEENRSVPFVLACACL